MAPTSSTGSRAASSSSRAASRRSAAGRAVRTRVIMALMKEPCFALADPEEEKPDHLLLSDQSTDDTGSDVVSVTSCRPSLEDCAECRLYRAAEGRRRVVFVRHGETDFNLAGKIQGTLESQLTEKGHAQAHAAGAFLAADLAGAVDRVLCSSKARTMATLDDIEAAFATAGAALPERMVLEDLREIELTGWEGQCKKDIQRDDAAAWKAWKASPADFVFPSGFAPEKSKNLPINYRNLLHMPILQKLLFQWLKTLLT